MTIKRFVHLNVHSEYSIVDSTIRIPQLIAQVKQDHMPAVALTDVNNLFAAVKFFNEANKQGIKPILGADVRVQLADSDQQWWQITLLCQNKVGYRNLSILLSKAQEHLIDRDKTCITAAMLEQHHEGLIALADSMESDVGHWIKAQKLEQAADAMLHWQQIFGNRYYLAVAKINRPNEQSANSAAIYMAANQSIPMVASGRVRFLKQADFNAHEARICINRGDVLSNPKRISDYSELQFLTNADEMAEQFKDHPQLLENSYQIAKRCNFDFNFKDYFLPEFPIPQGQTIDSYFRSLCEQSLTEYLTQNSPARGFNEADYFDRLKHEIDVILNMGFPGYFLIVSDFIKWSKEQHIPVGPGRGSGAGSLVALVLKITNLDPLRYELLFERFLNPERISMPDFDVDFCMDRRDEVIAYVSDKYGHEKVSQIITYGSMNAKAVIRDAGRVLGYPYPVVDGIAKLIPNDLGIKLAEALKTPELSQLYEQDEEAQEVIDLSLKLEGLKRNLGKHAGGVVIAPSSISDFCPIYIEQQSHSVVSQFDKDDVEAIGLVKFDFLGLKTLTIIDWALQAIEQQYGKKIDLDSLPLNDQPTFQQLQAANTTSVFQLESPGMKKVINELKPDHFRDIIALVALYRPGPLEAGMVDIYNDCKHGRKQPDYMHHSLKEILEPTYGVILYQEQAMQIAQVLSGYTLGGADILRKAMGKKIPEVMAQQRQVFVDGAVENGIDKQLASDIFSNIEKFAGYGFNKSHSAAYALIAYQTAYLKTHYPAHFMAAVLSADMDNTDKIVNQIYDIKQLGITVKPPNINHSEYRFKADKNSIQYGLGAIKGVGENAIEDLLQARNEQGAFRSFQDFCNRVNLRKVNKRTLQSLINGGAFDELHDNRNQLLESINLVVKVAEQQNKDKQAGQVDLFSQLSGNDAYQQVQLPTTKPMPPEQRLWAEADVLGTFISDHPINIMGQYLHHACNLNCHQISHMAALKSGDQAFSIMGMITATRPGFKGGIKIKLNDQSGSYEFNIKDKLFNQQQELFERGQAIMLEGNCEQREIKDKKTGKPKEIYQISVQNAISLKDAIAIHCNKICLICEHNPEQLVDDIKQLLKQFGKGKARLYVYYKTEQKTYQLRLGANYKINPSRHMLQTALTKPSIQSILTK